MPDSAILTAAARVVTQTGPEKFTLADVGQEVGLSAATLVQRFGSKRLLMLAMLEQMTGLANGRFAAKVAEGQSPLQTLYAAALDRADPTHGPENVANGLAFLFTQIGDPEFHAIAVASARQAIEAYKTMLDNAIEAGELEAGELATGLDTQALAETIHSMTLGSLVMWVIYGDAGSKPCTKRDLDTLLRPYRRIQKPASNHAHDSKTKGPKSMTPAPVNVEELD
jgi:AcrR family transcriptional regulator